jgi:hypothetical protein
MRHHDRGIRVLRGILLRVHLFWDISLCPWVNMNSYIDYIQKQNGYCSIWI